MAIWVIKFPREGKKLDIDFENKDLLKLNVNKSKIMFRLTSVSKKSGTKRSSVLLKSCQGTVCPFI